MEDAPDPPGPPGSASNPFALPETPPKKIKREKKRRRTVDNKAGSVSNPFTLPDTPPQERLIIFKGPPSTILPHVRRRPAEDWEERRRRVERDLRARESASDDVGPTLDILDTAHARIRTVQAAISNPLPTNFARPAAAGTSRGAAGSSSASRSRPARSTRDVRENRNRPLRHVSMVAVLEAPAPAAAAASRAQLPGPRFYGGWRAPRLYGLKQEELWLDDERPPDQVATQPHHMCDVCQFVKSHPVSYACGHSHCYVCVRMWLEEHWTCPHCRAPMDRAPFRHYGEEATLLHEYPEWNDESAVDYSFNGLVFPTVETELVPATP